MYDDKKLEAAFDAWVKKRTTLGYGCVYVRALLADFENFLAETKMLQASPGIVAFGKQLTRIGCGVRRVSGATHRTGIQLLSPPPQVEPVTYGKTRRRKRTAEATRTNVAKGVRRRAVLSKEERKKRKKAVRERMAAESADSAQAAAQDSDGKEKRIR